MMLTVAYPRCTAACGGTTIFPDTASTELKAQRVPENIIVDEDEKLGLAQVLLCVFGR